MSSSQEVYTQIAAKLEAIHPTLHWRRLTNWIWIIVGLVQSQLVHLSQIALHIPGPAEEAGRIARIRRWLANHAVKPRERYDPIIRSVLSTWRGREVTIILDGCFIRHKTLQMLRRSLSHCYRALPLAWEVVTSKGNVEVAVCERMLRYVAELLGHTRRVTFLADRGFRGREWAKLCVALRWRYMIRLANNTIITVADGRQVALDQLGIRPGQRRYFTKVRLTQEADWGCHLAITWTRPTPGVPAELCAIMTNWVPSAWILKHYLKRMHIEESFRDEQAGSFDLHHSHLRDAQRLDHLLLAIAVATLWIYELGEQVLREGKRADVDPAYKRHLSVFQLGWRTLRRAIACFAVPACTLALRPFRPEPVYRGRTDGKPSPRKGRLDRSNGTKPMC
jgi:hypothetical protein